MNLQPVIDWLERGCDPMEAANELRVYQATMDQQRDSVGLDEAIALIAQGGTTIKDVEKTIHDIEWRRTMGEIAQVARCLVGGEDINGFDYPSASIEDAAPLIAQLRDLLDKYDRQMIEATRDE